MANKKHSAVAQTVEEDDGTPKGGVVAEGYQGDVNQPSPALLLEIYAALNGLDKTPAVEAWMAQYKANNADVLKE
jgi:hypothetical protein